MSWQFVFNSNLYKYCDFEEMLSFVRTTEYQFFTFNGVVHSVIDGSEIGITTNDLF